MLNGSVVARRINVTRFTFRHLLHGIPTNHPCGLPHTSVGNTTRSAHFSPLVCFLFVSFYSHFPLPPKCLCSKILERLQYNSNWPVGGATFYAKCHSLSISIHPVHHHGQHASENCLQLTPEMSKGLMQRRGRGSNIMHINTHMCMFLQC